jgi:hypothetical protein
MPNNRGIADEKAEIAKRLRDMGIPVSNIAQASGLTTEESAAL